MATGPRSIGRRSTARNSGAERAASDGAVLPYERQLDQDSRWALDQGGLHFEGKSAVFLALRKITKRLEELNVPYAVVGGMALFQHGLRRFTEDVDILVTRDGLKRIHDSLEGLGYLPSHARSKHLRDTESGVRIEFRTAGGHPGDGKPKPVAFPDPGSVAVESDGVRYVDLPTLVELKLTSGMTSPGRLKDLADVQELIKRLDLPAELSGRLDPYVRPMYLELWSQGRTRFVAVWSSARMAAVAETVDAMRGDGVAAEDAGPDGEDRVRFVTTDPVVAERYGLIEESEYWPGDGE